MNDSDETGLRAELWLRSTAPQGGAASRTGALGTLQRLGEAPAVETVRLRAWPSAMSRAAPVAWTEEGRAVFETYEAVSEWATDADVSLAPFFEEKTAQSAFTGEEDTVVHLPAMALVEYRDGEVVHVAPHTDGQRTLAVDDRIDALAPELADGAVPTTVPGVVGDGDG